KAEDGASDDRESSESASDQFGEIIARDIFDDFAATGSESAIGKRQRHANDQVAQSAESKAQRAAVIRREHAADGGLLGPERIKREALAVLSERGLQFLDGAAGFDADGEIRPGVFDNFIEAGGGENNFRASGRIAPGKLGAAAARNHGEAGIICETKNSGKLLFVRRLEDEPRLNAANCVRRSGLANGIRRQNRAKFVFDVERSGGHWRDSVHYNSKPAHSHRSAVAGSINEARLAGKRHANPEAPIKRRATNRSSRGSLEPPSVHRASIFAKDRLRKIPAATPLPTLSAVPEKTSQRTSLRCAPNAMRIPNSPVLCAML